MNSDIAALDGAVDSGVAIERGRAYRRYTIGDKVLEIESTREHGQVIRINDSVTDVTLRHAYVTLDGDGVRLYSSSGTEIVLSESWFQDGISERGEQP